MDLSKEIADISTVSEIDTTDVIVALFKLIPKHILNGEIVRLGDFGSYNARISSDGMETEQSFNKSLIKGLKLYFRPGKELKKALNEAEFEKAQS